MIINCKERFGYTYFYTTDPELQNIFLAYCEGHGFWWNAFLGWRKSVVLDHDVEQMFFWIPTKKLEILYSLAKGE